MFEIDPEQLETIPFFDDVEDHVICSKLVKLSVDSKYKMWPMAWGESTKDRPVVNIRIKDKGYIKGGELGFYFDDFFVVIIYTREHRVNPARYNLNSGDGRMWMDRIYIGSSPKPENNRNIDLCYDSLDRDVIWNEFKRAVGRAISDMNYRKER